MRTDISKRDAELDTVQIRVYVRDKRRLDRIAQFTFKTTGRFPSYPMLVKMLLDAPLSGDAP